MIQDPTLAVLLMIGIYVLALIFIELAHHREMYFLEKASTQRLELVKLCWKVPGPYLGTLVVDTPLREHVACLKRGKDWASIYPDPVRKMILADRRRKIEAKVDKVIAFPVKRDVPPDGAA